MKKRNKYPPDFKLQVVKEYLTSDLSLSDIASKFDIPSVNILHRWVKLYTDSDITTTFLILKKIYYFCHF
jgi:transposase-like protein